MKMNIIAIGSDGMLSVGELKKAAKIKLKLSYSTANDKIPKSNNTATLS